MDGIQFEILPATLLKDYCEQISKDISAKFEVLKDSELSANTFSFYASVSAVFSSKIEGEDIELDSFIKHKLMGVKFIPDHTQKIDDLYKAYQFAKLSPLNADTIRHAHTLLTMHLLQKQQRGALRTGNMFVTTKDGKIEHVACVPGNVNTEINKLYNDIAILLDTGLSVQEVFFFAAMIHLVFVKIHPFNDGNGRMARLLEKWFLSQNWALKPGLSSLKRTTILTTKPIITI